MDRLNQLRAGGESGAGRDSLDASSPSEAYMSANESSKYFSLSDSTFDITPIKDVSLASTAAEPDPTQTDPDELMSNLSPITKKDVMLDSFKIGKQIDAANILSGGVDIFDDNDNSFDGHELVIDDAVEMDDKSNLEKESQFKVDENVAEAISTPVDVANKDTEVVLQIDGKNVDAIDIGNGLYLYRKEGQEELAAVQIINDDDQQQPSFKFLKVRENAEGNLEVYEEFEIEVTKDVSTSEVATSDKITPHLPIKNINKVESSSSKLAETKEMTISKEVTSTSTAEVETLVKDTPADSKTEVNLNGKMMKFSESRKSPVVGSFTPMTYHSTPNKEGKPLTKTMVDLQLHPSRHSDNVKKTIELHTDSQSKKLVNEDSLKQKTDTERKKIRTDMISKEVSIQNEAENKTTIQNSQKQENYLSTVKDCVSVSTDNIRDSKQAVYEKANELVISNAQADDKEPVNVSKMIVDTTLQKDNTIVSTNTTPPKENIKIKEDNVTVSNIENIESAKISVDDKDDENKLVSSNPEDVIVSNTFNTETNEACKNDITANTNDLETNEGSFKSSAVKKTDKPLEVISRDDGKKHATKDVIDRKIPESEEINKNQKEFAENLSEAATSKKDLSLQNQSKDVKYQTNMPNSQKCNEASSTSTLCLITKPIHPVDTAKASKIPIIDTKITTVSPTLKTSQPATNQQNFKLQTSKIKSSETLIPKHSEPPTVDKLLDPKLEPKNDKPNPIAKSIELKKVPKVENLNPVSKPIEAKTKSVVQKSNPIEKQVEPEAFLNIEKCSSDLKSISAENKLLSAMSVPNIGKINPVPKEIESKLLLKTEKLDVLKEGSAPEKSNLTEKKVGVTKAVPKIDNICSVEKVNVAKAFSKTENKNLGEKKIKPETIAKVDKLPAVNVITKDKDEGILFSKNTVSTKGESSEKNEIKILRVTPNSEAKPINNNHTAVPFGKWTDANRQEFLNKFKDVKVPTSSNTKQIKNSNDLNRIDILKKIDSQRSNNASAKTQDKSNTKDSVFSNKTAPSKTVTIIPVKSEELKLKAKPVMIDSSTSYQSIATTAQVSCNVTAGVASSTTTLASDFAKEPTERIVNVTDLISKTIIGMLNKAPMPMTNVHSTLVSPHVDSNVAVSKPEIQNTDTQGLDEDSRGSLDDIEMKMNELHGIPFVERPPHELPKVHKTYGKSKEANAANNLPKKQNLAPATTKHVEDNVIDIDSDEEVIGHEPITGDIEVSKKVTSLKLTAPVKINVSEKAIPKSNELLKKEAVITENDFDKFAGTNAIAYENCLTVKFDGKETANVVQSVKEKDAATKLYPGNKMSRIEPKTKIPAKQNINQNITSQVPNTAKPGTVTEDTNSKNYQSKIASAYQSALNSKRQTDRPITIIEDKPVKVVFMDANAEFVTNKLNVQGKELSPVKKVDAPAVTNTQSGISDKTKTTDDITQQDDTKTKTKHQRKQVLNPIEVPELELIQSSALEVSPKKKRKFDDKEKTEKGHKNLVHKKQYLLGRSAATDDNPQLNQSTKDTVICAENVTEHSTVSAIDSLVKAAELLENQTRMIADQTASLDPDIQQNTPVKRGRGRPRKYPLPEGATDIKVASPSPHKKPRLIDSKPVKRSDPDTDENSSDDEEMIRENWTMGKINENIVCPICNKLFRSENVVFKHVKHCTGVSPSRSDSEKLSPRRMRLSRESDYNSPDNKSDDMDEKPSEPTKNSPKKRKSKESIAKEEMSNSEVIVIENTPVKESDSKTAEDKHEKPKKVTEDIPATEKAKTSAEEKPPKEKKVPKSHSVQQLSNLVCEFCGKTFRQLSYLVNHKLQHRKDQSKKLEPQKQSNKLQVFSCEVCKKEFRKLHHLVQHRIIHNPEVPRRTTRKSSSEQSDTKPLKVQAAPKQSEDPSAGFRCEPCDKSFRKLHHLVEHRETHDGINRQKTNAQSVIEKPPPPPQCDVCKKTFRKLHHLIEHKEQHVEQVETSSEKSDDKSVKSALSTKDIIHECSLCYMVFPNEHSLNKHFVICQQKKKRQSKAKETPENVDGSDKVEESAKSEDSMDEDSVVPKTVTEEIIDNDETANEEDSKNVTTQEKVDEKTFESEKHTNVEVASSDTDKVEHMEISSLPVQKEEITELISTPAKRNLPKSNDNQDFGDTVPEKIKKNDFDDQHVKVKPLLRKTSIKDKIAPTVTKRQKTSMAPLPVLHEGKPESSDDDDVRYMLNPDLQVDEISQGKAFMKVRTHKRNSLQIERPNSSDLMKRRTSLQHPLKIPRLKGQAVEPKTVPTTTKSIEKVPKLEAAASIDSDDSDVKYSFPEPVSEKVIPSETPKEKKAPRKSISEKRKSLSGIAKRKSLGQAFTAKIKANSSPVRIIKRRTLDVEHRCDCGELFNSAALLTRHTSLAHTPPRIRRRRSPPPAPVETIPKPPRKSTSEKQPAKATRKSSVASNSTAKPIRKSSVASTSNVKPARKSSAASNSVAKPTKSGAKSDTAESRKSIINPEKGSVKSSSKTKRSTAHRGVPVPEKLRKLMMKNAK